jgi:hypothetical protein
MMDILRAMMTNIPDGFPNFGQDIINAVFVETDELTMMSNHELDCPAVVVTVL